MKIITTLFSGLLALSIFSTPVFAANVSASISLEPSNPAPNSSVTVSIESYSFDVNTAFISWEIGGKTVKEGQGEKSITIKTGAVGNTTEITVFAQTADGSSIEQKISVTPASVSLVYEAQNSYVPPFYEGRSLPSDGALIRVTALPQLSDNGVPLSPSSLNFTWYINDQVLKTASGLGKQSALVRLDYLRTENQVKVNVRSPLGNLGTKTISVYSHPIMPILYEYDPLLGTNFTRRIDKRFETVSDFSVILEPFYVSINEPKEPSYEWFLDGLPSTPLGGKILSLHPKENSFGTKSLSILVSGPDKRIQKGEIATEIIFDTRR